MTTPLTPNKPGSAFGFDLAGLIARTVVAAQPDGDSAAVELAAVRDLKKMGRPALRALVVSAVLERDAVSLKRLILAGAPLDGRGQNEDGYCRLELLAVRYFSDDVVNALFPALELQGRPGLAEERQIRELVIGVRQNADPRPALLWLQNQSTRFSHDLFLDGYLSGLTVLADLGVNAPAPFLEDRLRDGLDRVNKQNWAVAGIDLKTKDEAVRSLWSSRLTRSDGVDDAADHLDADEFSGFCRALLAYGGLRHVRADTLSGLDDLLKRRTDLATVFSNELDKVGRSGTWRVKLPQQALQKRQTDKDALCTVAPEAIDLRVTSVAVSSFLGRLVLESPLCDTILRDPVSAAQFVTDALIPEKGRGLLISVVCGLDIDELMALVRDHRNAVSAFRDGNGNTFAHYMVALRSESRAIVEALARADHNLLSAPNNDGVMALDLISGANRVHAERVALKKESGGPVRKPAAGKRSF